MKKIILVVSAALLAFSFINMPAWSQPSKETLHNKSIRYINDFFPRVEGSFIGDPITMVNLIFFISMMCAAVAI